MVLPIRPPVCLPLSAGMPTHAAQPGRATPDRPCPVLPVRPIVNGAKVGRVHARLISAYVVEYHPGGDRTYRLLVGDSVCDPCATTFLPNKYAVPLLVCRRLPNPARIAL